MKISTTSNPTELAPAGNVSSAPVLTRALFSACLRREIEQALKREPGLTRADLASRMIPGYSQNSALSLVRTYLSKRRWPKPEQLDDLAAGLGVPVATLFTPGE